MLLLGAIHVKVIIIFNIILPDAHLTICKVVIVFNSLFGNRLHLLVLVDFLGASTANLRRLLQVVIQVRQRGLLQISQFIAACCTMFIFDVLAHIYYLLEHLERALQ